MRMVGEVLVAPGIAHKLEIVQLNPVIGHAINVVRLKQGQDFVRKRCHPTRIYLALGDARNIAHTKSSCVNFEGLPVVPYQSESTGPT